ncbi:hypothetical protein FJV46_08985 [Arthrobacter agilis]|uniref:hypothetical protein n=1 Tax=Arthrobacter agilis TaxID=37921 RepID=UPI000B35A891|nr:hypothetical protein [Arthrobacter agilis]OUM43578.1 hypothetical protein B8W74_05225 [Arthrobacter agilis]PPB47652.1 hypothetical protein CI784_01005 [Arthrobacter agilis]TPV24825.1 hypothetical protein FJV46_08985 [Arthrobacter agilis]VDR30969.1 Uncharacterised protein [Arthrobacter agilis]
MTIIDRPTITRRPTTSPQPGRTTGADAARRSAGTYVTTPTPRPDTEGAYVTSSADERAGRVSALRRGTYVSTATFAPQLGGYYTYSG